MRAGINPAPTVLFVGEGFIPSLLVQLPRESGRDLVFARGSNDSSLASPIVAVETPILWFTDNATTGVEGLISAPGPEESFR
jgi:hypothetical protein